MTDPKDFRPVSPRVQPRFSGVSTFLRLPLHERVEAGDKLDVVICGAPFDGGTTFRPGARFGPRAVRAASALTRGFHPDPGVDLFEHLRCADGGDIPCVPMSIERSLAAIQARVAELAALGVLPVLVGGDHTITLGALRALAKLHGPLGLLHFDAHSDTFGPAWGVDVHHGTVFRNALDEGLLRAGDVLQIGIRGPFTAKDDLAFAVRHGVHIVTTDEIKRDPSFVKQRIAEVSRRGACYVTFDMDSVDPAYAPGTGTPVPGGLTSYEALTLVRAVHGARVVGADVVEISPDHDVAGNTALLAATILAQLLAEVAHARAPQGSVP